MRSHIKKIISAVLICAVLCSFASCLKEKKKKFTDYSFDYFDTATTIVGYEYSEEDFKEVCKEIKAKLERYHKLFNIYDSFKGIDNLKTLNEKREIKADADIIEMLKYCKEIYSITQGKTNIALGSVLSIWHKYRSEGEKNPEKAALPPMEELKSAILNTDIDAIQIDEQNAIVKIADPKVLIDVGAIAKGYAVEKVGQWLKQSGHTDYLLNVGGNVKSVGKRADGKAWSVGIENPQTEKQAETPYIAYLKMENKSLVTSGSYQRYYIVNGQRYHHIIDPETLMPSDYFLSVSVLCQNSALGDALSTALFSMPQKDGETLISSLSGVEAMWVLKDGTKVFSKGFNDFTFEP